MKRVGLYTYPNKFTKKILLLVFIICLYLFLFFLFILSFLTFFLFFLSTNSYVHICHTYKNLGTYYKRNVCTVTKLPNEPRCSHCLTNCSYKIPRGTAHLFAHNPKPFVAYENYPQQVVVQAGVRPGKWRRIFSVVETFFLGIRENMQSRLSYNDWRLKLLMYDNFPEIPRQPLVLSKHQINAGSKAEPLEVGEIAECKLQKSEWSRCRVTNSRTLKPKMYDIR